MRVSIDGMHDHVSVNRVRLALESLAGVRVIEVVVGSAEIIAEPQRQSEVFEAIERAGYTPILDA